MKQGTTSIATKSSEKGLSTVQVKNRPFFVQTKLKINQPGDNYEQEADAMAETVMRMPAPKNDSAFFKSSPSLVQRKCAHCEEEEKKLHRKEIKPDKNHEKKTNALEPGLKQSVFGGADSHQSKSSIVQRKCAHCEEEEKKELRRKEIKPGESFEKSGDAEETVVRSTFDGGESHSMGSSFIQRKCAHCEEEEKKLRRKEKNSQGVSSSPQFESYVGRLQSKGETLSPPLRSFFEPRFGYDFSKVKIHTDGEANRSAQSINALAYTSGNNIVFNQNQFSANNETGKKLLAHELTHVVQQGSSSKNGSTSGTSVQRKPQQMDTIRDRLTRSAGDWAVTDQDVKDVLLILDPMKDPDFKDTIAAMDAEKLVQELYDEISDEDKANFPALLRRIQMNRVRTLPDGKKIVDSCLPDKRKKIDETLGDIKTWAKKCFEEVNGYIFRLQLSSEPDPKVATALETNFFHQAQNGNLSDGAKIKFANKIAENFKKVEQQSTPFTHVCLQPYDPICSSIALAYVSHSDKTVNYCWPFFNEDRTRENRVAVVFHELFHVFALVGDTGYGHERVYQYLPPTDAVNNADSYENFAVQILKPKNVEVSKAKTDEVSDCNADQGKMIRQRIAYAARMITNALNVIGDPDHNANKHGGANEIFFKTIVRSELSRVIERFKEIDTAFNAAVGIECESSCDKDQIAYNRALGSVVHICPAYFNMGEDNQVDWILVYIADRKAGGDIKDQPGSAKFGKQDKDAAYKNLWTYVAYARSVTEASSSWKFLKAEFRHEREIQESFEQLIDMVPEITEEQSIRADIRGRYINTLQTALNTELAAKKIESVSDTESVKKNYTGKLNDLMKIAVMVSDGYKKFDGEAFSKWMFVDKADQNGVEKILNKIRKKVKEDLMQELDNQFKIIQAGGKVDFTNTATTMQAISKGYIDKLKLLDGYLSFIHEVSTLDEPIEKHKDKLKSKLPASKQSKFESDYVFNMLMLFEFDKDSMYDSVGTEIINGKPFNPKSKPADPDAAIKKYKAQLDEEFKKAKSGK